MTSCYMMYHVIISMSDSAEICFAKVVHVISLITIIILFYIIFSLLTVCYLTGNYGFHYYFSILCSCFISGIFFFFVFSDQFHVIRLNLCCTWT